MNPAKLIAFFSSFGKSLFGSEIYEGDDDSEYKINTNREICRSGLCIDGRELSADWIRSIVENTEKYIFGNGIHVPVCEGHYDWDEALKGRILRLWVNEYEDGRCSMMCNMELYGKTARAYEMNRLPGVSIEAPGWGCMPDGEEFGPHLYGVALLGRSRAALPDLMKMSDVSDLKEFEANFSDKRFHVVLSSKENVLEVKNMKQSREEMAKQIGNMILGAMDDGGGTPGNQTQLSQQVSDLKTQVEKLTELFKSTQADNERYQAEIAALKLQQEESAKAQTESQKDTLLAQLRKDGKVADNQIDGFNVLYNALGHDKTVEHYGTQSANTPASGSVIPSKPNHGNPLRFEEALKDIKYRLGAGEKVDQLIKDKASYRHIRDLPDDEIRKLATEAQVQTFSTHNGGVFNGSIG